MVEFKMEYYGNNDWRDYLRRQNELMHFGIPKRSGRYPWGSGEDPYHHGADAPGGKKKKKSWAEEKNPIKRAIKFQIHELTNKDAAEDRKWNKQHGIKNVSAVDVLLQDHNKKKTDEMTSPDNLKQVGDGLKDSYSFIESDSRDGKYKLQTGEQFNKDLKEKLGFSQDPSIPQTIFPKFTKNVVVTDSKGGEKSINFDIFGASKSEEKESNLSASVVYSDFNKIKEKFSEFDKNSRKEIEEWYRDSGGKVENIELSTSVGLHYLTTIPKGTNERITSFEIPYDVHIKMPDGSSFDEPVFIDITDLDDFKYRGIYII